MPHPVSSTTVQQRLEPEFVHPPGPVDQVESVHRPGSSHREESTNVQRHRYHTRLQARQSAVASSFSSKDERSFVQGFWDRSKGPSVRMRPGSLGTSL